MKINPTIPASANPGAIEAQAIQFYVGQDALKIKSVDKFSGAGFTVAYLRPTFVDKDPIKRELALDFAALAVAAPKLLAAAKKALEECVDLIATPAGEALSQAIAEARREVPTQGVVSPDLAAMAEKM